LFPLKRFGFRSMPKAKDEVVSEMTVFDQVLMHSAQSGNARDLWSARDRGCGCGCGSRVMSFAANSEILTRLFVGNLEYVLLIISMMMTRMLMLRVVAISSGVAGMSYSWLWLSDPVGTLWEIVFTGVNIGQIALFTFRNRSTRFNDEERAFYSQVVPLLEPYQVRRHMAIGTWLDGEPGSELTRQGEFVSHLVFLKPGRVSVLVNNNPVGYCTPGNLIGEISIRTGKPATATAIAKGCIRYLA